MRVGLVIYGSLDTISGGYLYDRMLVNKLRQRGDEVAIISMRRRSYAGNLLDNLAPIEELNFDVLLQDELNHPSLFAMNGRSHGAPIISIVHHLRSSERRPRWQNVLYCAVERAYLNSVDGFIFNSETTRASVDRLTRRHKPSVVAHPGGDRLGSSTRAHVLQRAQEPGPLRLLCLGSVTPGKGIDTVLDALATLPRNEFSLEVVGSTAAAPRYAEKMRRQADALHLPVLWSGQLADDELEQKLRSSHALVLPSYYEGFGIAYLEGMAHGLPALGTLTGAIPDLVRDGVEGYLVRPGDARALAQRIIGLGRRRDLLARLSLAAIARFKAASTWDDSTERIREFLLSVRLPKVSDEASEKR